MSHSAQRFTKKKPVLSARSDIHAWFEAMEAEQADFMAMLADHDYGRFDDEFGIGLGHDFEMRETNRLFLDMCYEEKLKRENEADRMLEEAHQTFLDNRYGGYDLH